MASLETTTVEVRFFRLGSTEETESVHQAADLNAGLQLVHGRFPEAALVRCCQQEPDGGCAFVYPTAVELELDEADAAQGKTGAAIPPGYGRWIGIISSAAREEATCSRPARHRS